MADKQFQIAIETTADTKGATEATAALDNVANKGQALDSTLDKTDGAGLKKIPAAAAPAANSIDALERKVQELSAELNKLPAGSTQFLEMASRVKVAQTSLQGARAEASKLGALVGKQGNAGTAVLEFSRAFEDAQFGIRGVLNNLPGLIASLGGSAGLAGVISVVAVAGSVLWDVLSKGAKDATVSTFDYLDAFRKLAQEFGNTALEIEQARGDAADVNLGKLREFASEQQRLATSEAALEKKRITGDGGVTVAKARLDLSRLETQLLFSSGEKAVKLAKEREETLKRIVALEREAVELVRQAEERAAVAKVTAAQETLRVAQQTQQSAGARASTRAEELQAALNRQANATDERTKTIRTTTAIRDDIDKQVARTTNPIEITGLEILRNDLTKQIDLLNKNPSQFEAQAIVETEALTAANKAAQENFKASSEDLRAAAASVKTFTADLANLRGTQAQDRKTEGEVGVITNTQEVEAKKLAAGQKTANVIGGGVEVFESELGNVAKEPPVRDMIAKIKELVADGVQAGEQNEVTNSVQALVAKIKKPSEDTTKLFNQVLAAINSSVDLQNKFDGELRTLNSKVKAITLSQGQRNP